MSLLGGIVNSYNPSTYAMLATPRTGNGTAAQREAAAQRESEVNKVQQDHAAAADREVSAAKAKSGGFLNDLFGPVGDVFKSVTKMFDGLGPVAGKILGVGAVVLAAPVLGLVGIAGALGAASGLAMFNARRDEQAGKVDAAEQQAEFEKARAAQAARHSERHADVPRRSGEEYVLRETPPTNDLAWFEKRA